MLTRFSIKNYQLTIAVFIMVGILGINSFINMPRSEDPSIKGAFFYIVAVYPGASPKDLEELIVDPLEETINELDDITKLNSSMNDGLAVVNVEFDFKVDGDRKYDEVLRQVNNIRSKLPQDLYSIDVYRWSTTNVNILQYALVSDKIPYKDIETQAKRLKKEIEKTASIKKVEISAYPKQQIRIEVDLQKVAQKGIPLNQLMNAIQSNNANIPGGDLDMGNRKFNIKSIGNFQDIEDIKNTVVHAGNGNVVYLKDLANIAFDYEEQTHIGRYMGKKAIFVTASQKENTNIFQVVQAVDKNVKDFAKTVPGNIKLEKAFDQSVSVGSRLNRLYVDFGIAIFLILITLLPLGTRASIIVMIAIPSSLFIGIVMMYLTGYSLNQLSIVGLVISLGLLVDDSIVVVENIVRFMRNGYNRYEATLKATSQISWAVIGCTATMIVAFVPIIMLPGGPGEFISSLPVAVVFTLLASLLVSFTLTPFIASRFLKEKEYEKENFFHKMLNKVNDGPYQALLMKGLKFPKTTIAISVVAVALSLMLLPVVGFSLFPTAEKPQFFINVESEAGSNLNFTDSISRKVEQLLKRKPEVMNYCTNVGKGNPMVYYNITQANEQTNFAQFFVQLKEYDQKATPVFLDNLGKELRCIPGARIEIKEFKNGTPQEAPIEIAFFGPNLDTLKRLSLVGENLLKGIKGTSFVQNPTKTSASDLKIVINKDKAGMLGVTIFEIQKTIRMAMVGLSVGNFTDTHGKEYAINFTLDGNKKKVVEDLDKIYIGSLSGAQIPLKLLANIEFDDSPTLIEHYKRERSITVRANVLPGYLVDNVTKETLDKLEKLKLPEDYRYEPFGEYSSRQETFGNMNTAIIITFFVIF